MFLRYRELRHRRAWLVILEKTLLNEFTQYVLRLSLCLHMFRLLRYLGIFAKFCIFAKINNYKIFNNSL